MKKIFLLLVAMVAVSGMCLAQSGSCGDNLNWSYDGAGTLTITGTGEMTDFTYMANEPWYSFQADITSVSLPNGITRIGEHAFYNCSNLATINLPSGLLTIGNGAFDHTALTAVVLPEGVTTLGMNAFNYCPSLVSVTIPTSVTDLSRQAFWNCILLADVTVHWTTNDALPTLGIDVFRNIKANAKLHVPYGTTSLYSAAAQWSSFNIVEMNPQGKCGDNLYWEYDPSTTTLTITGKDDMWDYLGTAPAPWHDYRTEITTVILPNELTGIGSYAFYNCSNLTSVTIPNSVTSIGDYAFEGCSGLTSVILPSSLQSIGNNAFRNCKILTSIDIPSNVTSIGQYAFNGCKALESVTIPEGVTAINSATFLGCIGLTSINLPSHLTSIGSSAFKNCSTLTSITLPISVTAISTHSFDRCTGLTDMYVSWETNITGVGSLVFDGVTLANIRLHVPCGTKSAYAAASVWQDFTIVDPCEGHYPITAKADPNDASTYYSTFYYGTAKYLVPENVEAYAAAVDGGNLVLTKIADAGEVLPAETAVILKSTIGSYTMVPSTDAAITNTAGNQLLGVDETTTAPEGCYVLSGHSSDNSIVEVGFYTFSGTLGAHKAYLVMPSSNPAPPRYLRFVFDSAMDIEQPTSDSSLKGGEKILLDGVLYIERGEHLYNAQGVRVK